MVGADNQEFIKLYNPNDQAISLASSSLQYLSGTASGIDKVVKKNFTATSSIAATGFFLIGTGAYAMSSPPVDMLWSQALSNSGASVFLVANAEFISSLDDPDIVDRVVYTSTTPGEVLITNH